MELHKLHILQRGTSAIRERMAVAGVLPAVRRDLEGASYATSRQHDSARSEKTKAAALAIVRKCPRNAIAVFQQCDHRALHVHVDALMYAVILQRADHLETRAIADVREPRITMSSEVALQDATIRCAIEQRAPCLELADS